MQLSEKVDHYCERLDVTFWSEPINAWSNVSFFAAALVLWLTARRQLAVGSPLRRDVTLLLLMLIVVGIGSFLFHTVATTWAMLADVIPIILAVLWFLWIYLRRIESFGPLGTALGFLGFFAASAAFSTWIPSEAVNGSQAYFPVVVALVAMAYSRQRAGANEAASLFKAAAAIFTISLIFRSIDLAICPSFAWGTHFLWHLLNGLALWVATRALLSGGAYSRA